MTDTVDLNPDQTRALDEIEASIVMRRQHLLLGAAGTGKTTLMQEIAKLHHAQRHKIVLTAPTHKAVSVLERKLKVAGIDIPCRTIHSLLSLRPKAQGDKQIFVRAPKAKPVNEDIIIIDEASMLDSSLMTHIDRHLDGRAVVFCGDGAQLPPVGEVESRSLATVPASRLETIVRQAEGNPIIAAAHIIRESQKCAEFDWSWCKELRKDNTGVFTPHRRELDGWMKRAFADCGEFQKDADFARYLCWTNARVAEINARVRRWMHPSGTDLSMPFIPGEVALIRSPLVIDEQILIATNEEVRVEAIEANAQIDIPTWKIKVITEAGMDHDIHMPRDWDAYRIALAEIADRARVDSWVWDEYHEFKAAFINAQQCMALTTHNSQGSTFRYVFQDLPDVRRRIKDNPLEAKQLMYTQATRPSDGLILIGV